MQAAAKPDPTLSRACIPLPRRAALLSREVLLVLQPEPSHSKALEGEFPIRAALQPLGQPGAGGPSGRAMQLWETAFPTATQGDFIPNTLYSPLIQVAFRKRKCSSALITSPESGYCLISSCCHLNTVSHGERTGQSVFVPRHSPVRPRQARLPFACAGSCPSQCSPTALAHGKARWVPKLNRPTAAGRNARSQPCPPLRCPRSPGEAAAALVFHLAPQPRPSRHPR